MSTMNQCNTTKYVIAAWPYWKNLNNSLFGELTEKQDKKKTINRKVISPRY